MSHTALLFDDELTPPPKGVESIEWYTPAAEVELVHRVFGGPPELDPMSCEAANQIVGARRFFDRAIDGLAQPWRARTIYLNPVTGLTKAAWRKLCAHFEAGDFEAAIWAMFSLEQLQTLQHGEDRQQPPPPAPLSFPLCVSRARTNWLRGDPSQLTMFGPQPAGSPRHGTAFVLLDRAGSYTERFVEVFGELGALAIPTPPPTQDKCPLCEGQVGATVSQRWEITLTIEPPSQNRLAANKGGQRWQYRALRTQYEQALDGYTQIPRAEKRRRLQVIRLIAKGKRRYDYGNLVGGCKPLVDACVNKGLLVDDNPAHLEAYYRQERCPTGEGGVRLVLEELA